MVISWPPMVADALAGGLAGGFGLGKKSSGADKQAGTNQETFHDVDSP